MSTFQKNLAGLPDIDDLSAIALAENGVQVATIENKAGSQGSLRVYRHLAMKYGNLTPAAAQEGLNLYAEHTEDARHNPGKHPNIDRLFDLIARQATLTVNLISI